MSREKHGSSWSSINVLSREQKWASLRPVGLELLVISVLWLFKLWGNTWKLSEEEEGKILSDRETRGFLILLLGCFLIRLLAWIVISLLNQPPPFPLFPSIYSGFVQCGLALGFSSKIGTYTQPSSGRGNNESFSTSFLLPIFFKQIRKYRQSTHY